ncbi:cytochrome P450 [Achaetomium macrosporum]|uniref:Cytochrome P450 n=1 Tax=Achaetomium macrosporum TaxID=79813 RepID=A0AAN7C323_9PEZI|nr:cytochrome P450 [Achaetomium macrosporum]
MEDLIQTLPTGNTTTVVAPTHSTSLVQYLQSLTTTTRLGLGVCFLIWVAWTVTRHRRFYNDLPKPPHSWWFGHLALFRQTVRSLPKRVHPHAIILAIQQRYKLPPIFYLDWYPIFAPMIIITDPTVATQLTNAENLPRHSVVQDVMGELVGRHSVFWSNGPEWKHLRSTLTPGFSTTHLLSRVPRMLQHMLIFEEITSRLAATGEPFPILGKLISMTIDVIGDLMLDVRLAAQDETEFHPIVREFRAAMKFTWEGLNFWEKYVKLPGLRWHSRKLDNLLADEIRKRWEAGTYQAPETEAGIDLFLKKYDEERRPNKGEKLDGLFLEQCVHNTKGMLIAGHDTTAGTIAYCLLELAKHPDILARVRAEHDQLISPSRERTIKILEENPTKLHELPLTTAVVKEVLRLYSPASTIRKAGDNHTITYDGKVYPTKGHALWVVHTCFGRDPNLFSHPNSFMPDRFLAPPGTIPPGAWRAFEKGPRSCIGQGLALIEIKLALVVLCRRFDFALAYPAGSPSLPLMGEQAYQVMDFVPVPAGGMPMTVRERRYVA